jgi:hypothetical protein
MLESKLVFKHPLKQKLSKKALIPKQIGNQLKKTINLAANLWLFGRQAARFTHTD